MFFISLIKLANVKYNYALKISKDKINDTIIQLPITSSGEIDFDFMESFISELEEERMRKLNAYLQTTGLKNYELTTAEQTVLEKFEHVKWGEFKLGDLFIFKGIKQAKSQKEIPSDGDGIPYIVQSTVNNMCSRYVNRQYLIDNNEPPILGNAIVLGVTLPAVSYQPKEFGASQVIEARSYILNKNNGLFFVNAIARQMYQFSYQKKPGIKIYKNLNILLPQTENNEIDFDFMETFIKAIEKLVIKDVVQYADKRIAATAKLVK